MLGGLVAGGGGRCAAGGARTAAAAVVRGGCLHHAWPAELHRARAIRPGARLAARATQLKLLQTTLRTYRCRVDCALKWPHMIAYLTGQAWRKPISS